MKTTIKDFIKKHDWYHVNSDITDENFPPQPVENAEPTIFKLEKTMTSQEILQELKDKGLHPANIHELMEWFDKNKDTAEKGKYYVAFGSEWIDADGCRRVPDVRAGTDGGFEFGLGGVGGGWASDDCVLCFCDKTLDTQTLSTTSSLDTSLENAIAICKKAGLKVIRTKTVEEEL